MMNVVNTILILLLPAFLAVHGAKFQEGDLSPGEEDGGQFRERRSLFKHHHGRHWAKKAHWVKKAFASHWGKKINPSHWSEEVDRPHSGGDVNPKHWVTNISPKQWLLDVGSVFKYSSIYPGTKWCGDGNRAKSWSDLGRKWKPDTCCRAHDLCYRSVEAGKTKHGIHNHGLFTWSHCECDQAFYSCLKHSRTLDSDIIGVKYFDILDNYCIYEDYPETCNKILFFKVHCTKQTTHAKIWKKRKIDLTYFGKDVLAQ